MFCGIRLILKKQNSKQRLVDWFTLSSVSDGVDSANYIAIMKITNS